MSLSQKVLAQGSVKPPLAEGVLRIYSMRFCPFARRVLLVLAAKNIPYETVNIHLKQKPDWYLAINAEGKVPLLEQDNKLVNESLVIADYLDDAYLGPKLWSSDPYTKARGRLVIEQLGKITAHFYKMYVEKLPAAFEQVLVELNFFEQKLAEGNAPFFSGETAGMVDYMVWPILDTALYLWHAGIFDGEPFLCKKSRPLLTDWIERMSKDAAVAKVALPRDIEIEFKKSIASGSPNYDLGL